MSLPGLDKGSAVDLMDSMPSFLGSDDGIFLFPHLFLHQLLPLVHQAIVKSPYLTASDFWGFAEKADKVLLSSRCFWIRTW